MFLVPSTPLDYARLFLFNWKNFTKCSSCLLDVITLLEKFSRSIEIQISLPTTLGKGGGLDCNSAIMLFEDP